ncbi:MAG: NAD-dependent epimerase/dehydratase family protein [Candidatus Comchoanobacterales bacterium]
MIKTVAITGGSGYIALWVVQYCLEQNLVVHATVRDLTNPEKLEGLKTLQTRFPKQLHLFQADLLKQGSFDAAFHGVDAVIHTASPVDLTSKDPETDLMKPAVDGTQNVFSSIIKNPSIKKCVMTSSIAAIRSSHSSKPVLTEEDWNDDQEPCYATSKAKAERLAWSLAKKHHINLITINPSVVLGPSLSSRVDASSHQLIAPLLNGQFKWGIVNMTFNVVDVREVALAHINALFDDNAKGRYILASGQLTSWQAAKYLKKHLKHHHLPRFVLPNWLVIAVGPLITGISRDVIRRYLSSTADYDASKSVSSLNINYRSPEQSLLDHAQCLLQILPESFK